MTHLTQSRNICPSLPSFSSTLLISPWAVSYTHLVLDRDPCAGALVGLKCPRVYQRTEHHDERQMYRVVHLGLDRQKSCLGKLI